MATADAIRAQGASAPTAAELRRTLNERAGITWSEKPLREVLASIYEHWHVPVLRDRRIDPDQRVDLTLDDSPLSEILAEVARTAGGEVRLIDAVVYLGPADKVDLIAAVAELRDEEARALATPLGARLRERAPVEWDMLSEPRALIAQQARASGLALEGLDKIEHDLWAAGRLPPLPLAHRLSLLLAGFDLTYQTDPATGSLTIEPLDAAMMFERTYTLAPRSTPPLARWREQFPDAQFSVRGRQLRVRAPVAVQRQIADALASAARPPVPSAERPARSATDRSNVRYTLAVSGPFGPLAKGLAERLMFRLELDPESQPHWNTVIRVEVKDATLEQLLDALVKPVELEWELKGQELHVGTKDFVSP